MESISNQKLVANSNIADGSMRVTVTRSHHRLFRFMTGCQLYIGKDVAARYNIWKHIPIQFKKNIFINTIDNVLLLGPIVDRCQPAANIESLEV